MAPMNRREFKETCYHEAGHAVVARALGSVVEEVGVESASAGMTASDGVGGLDGHTARMFTTNMENELVVFLAGLKAQYTLLYGRVPTADEQERECDGDIANITFYAKAIVADSGRDLLEVLTTATRRARDLVLDHRRQIDKVARALTRQGRLPEGDLDSLLGPMEVRHEVDWVTFRSFMRQKIASLRASGQDVPKSHWDDDEGEVTEQQ